LSRELKKKSICLDELDDPSSMVYMEMKGMIEQMSNLPSWGNARDIKTLSKKMVNLVFKTAAEGTSNGQLILSGGGAVECMKAMLVDRLERCGNVPASTIISKSSQDPQQTLTPPPPLPPTPSTSTTHSTKLSVPTVKRAKATSQLQSDNRDPGVTDEDWNQLQADIQAAEAALKASEEELKVTEQNLREATKREDAERALAKKLAETRAKDAAAQNELKRQQEQVRLRECAAMAERQRIAAILEEKRKEEARQRQQEAKAQAALRQMGVCVAGFRWIKQSSGYRCAGGTHFVDNASLGI
jgi:hypothetical protein